MVDKTFMGLYKEHLKMVRHKLLLSSNELIERGFVHDEDKLLNPVVNKAYTKEFSNLKKIEFGTKEYKEYEKKHFDEAHQIHAQNRHHFYSHRNNLKDINLFDVLEAIIDISESARQYNNENYEKSFEDKGLYDLDIKGILNNTIEYLNEKDKK